MSAHSAHRTGVGSGTAGAIAIFSMAACGTKQGNDKNVAGEKDIRLQLLR
jgi:hypothetical protein